MAANGGMHDKAAAESAKADANKDFKGTIQFIRMTNVSVYGMWSTNS